MSIALDLINLVFVLLILLFCFIYLRLDPLKGLIILVHLIVIFFLNGVLFPASYFSDQFNYLDTTQLIRESFPVSAIKYHFIHRTAHYVAGTIFALFPLPFISSIYSLAMINFLLYLFLFAYLKKKRVSSNSVDFFFLLYPSFLLYSSLALRETLITLFMFFSLYFLLVEEKRNTAFIFSLPLVFMKIQNFLILILAYFIYIFLRKGSVRRYLIFIGAGLLVVFFGHYFPQVNFLFEKIDYYRFYLIAENFGYDWSFMANYDYQPFTNGFPMIPLVLKSFLYMLLKPFPWEVTNPVQLIQSIENIFIVALIVWVVRIKVHSLIIKQKLIFLNVLLVLSMTIYGLVTFNFGTAARFRFPFIVVYLIFYFYLLRIDKIISHELSQDYSSTPAIS